MLLFPQLSTLKTGTRGHTKRLGSNALALNATAVIQAYHLMFTHKITAKNVVQLWKKYIYPWSREQIMQRGILIPSFNRNKSTWTASKLLNQCPSIIFFLFPFFTILFYRTGMQLITRVIRMPRALAPTATREGFQNFIPPSFEKQCAKHSWNTKW